MNIGRPLHKEINYKIIHEISMIAFNNIHKAIFNVLRNIIFNIIFTSLSTLTNNNNYGLR